MLPDSHAGNASSNLVGVTKEQGILIPVGVPWCFVAYMCHARALSTSHPFRFSTGSASCRAQTGHAISDYIEVFYNQKQRHSHIGDMSPAASEAVPSNPSRVSTEAG